MVRQSRPQVLDALDGQQTEKVLCKHSRNGSQQQKRESQYEIRCTDGTRQMRVVITCNLHLRKYRVPIQQISLSQNDIEWFRKSTESVTVGSAGQNKAVPVLNPLRSNGNYISHLHQKSVTPRFVFTDLVRFSR